MNSSNSESLPAWIIPSRWRFYYGWVTLSVAALAMVGTLPGRTQGLGLITEPLLRDLQIDRVLFAQINLWATLLGSLLCLGIGRLLDRFGSRIVLTVVSLLLGCIVYAISRSTAVFWIAVLITLSRGFGQRTLCCQPYYRWAMVHPPIEHGDGYLFDLAEHRIHDRLSGCGCDCASERLEDGMAE